VLSRCSASTELPRNFVANQPQLSPPGSEVVLGARLAQLAFIAAFIRAKALP
jgi:hypothetical protein